MLHCPNCGAEYEAGLLHCPYCRSVDDYQDESEYLEDLDELKDRLEDLPEDVIREQNKLQTIEAAKDLKRIFLRVALVAAGFLMIFGISVFFDRVVFGNSEAKEREREREEYLWKQENLPKLDALYESKDYEGLLAFADETDNNGIFDWEHYPLLDGLRILKYIPDWIAMVEELEAEGRTDTQQYRDDLAFLLRDELNLLYFDKRQVSAEDAQIIKDLSAEYLADLETRFALTPEELEELEKKVVSNSGEIYSSECREFLKNR